MDIIEPLQQGAADGLCGLYAAINAVRLVSAPIQPLTHSQSMQLASDGFEYLKQKRKLETAITYGMGCSLQRKLLKHIVKKASKLSKLSFRYERIEVTQENWQYKVKSKVQSGHAVNLVLEGAYNHFTVITEVTDIRFELFDSYGFKWVRRDTCCLRNCDKKKRHLINPKSLVAIGI